MGIRLDDVTADSGVTFVHSDGHSGRRYIPETVTSGAASFDYDEDGRIDIYLGCGAALPGAHPGRVADALLRNLGGFKFRDASTAAGVDDDGFTVGMTAGDYDNDGFQDLYLSRFGTNRLFRNMGDGTFLDVTATAGVGRGEKLGAGVTFLDADDDGDLDLFVANYVRFSLETHVVVREDGADRYAGPRSYPLEMHDFFLNEGDGHFTDATTASGIGLHPGSGMGVVAGDVDDDGDTDLFVLNDVHRNFLFRNDGDGRFQEDGLAAGCAFNGAGDELGSMGVDAGDFDNDGWNDFIVTTYEGESPVLYRNDRGVFEDVTSRVNAGDGMVPHVAWGVGLVDFDNDGWRDIFYACGHLQDSLDAPGRPTAYRIANTLLQNREGRFRNVSRNAGSGLLPVASSRGAAFDDFDADGLVDAVILNAREGPTLARNTSPSPGNWLDVRLVGTHGSRDAVGATVRIESDRGTIFAEVLNGRGYQGYFGRSLHFGVGKAERVRVRVDWMGGASTEIDDVACGRHLTIVEPRPDRPTAIDPRPE